MLELRLEVDGHQRVQAEVGQRPADVHGPRIGITENVGGISAEILEEKSLATPGRRSLQSIQQLGP